MTATGKTARRGPGSAAGFTLIELMAVVAILSILAVIALSAYSDYVVRSKVSEGLAFAAEAKTTVSEYFYTNARNMPVDNQSAGLAPAANYAQYDYMERLEITSSPRPGTIEIEFDIPGLGTNNLLQLIPNTSNVEISWTCFPPLTNGIAVNRVPPNCRG